MVDKNLKQLKAISEKSRLLIINTLLESPMYVESIAKRLQLSPSTVSIHMKKLEEAGLVYSEKEQYYTVYHLNHDILDKKIIDLIKIDGQEKEQQEMRMTDYKDEIINKYIRKDGITLPKQRKKMLVILREIVDKYFEIGKDYTEKEVNLKIVDLGLEDFCFVRRSMICEKLMTRDDGIYRVIEQ